MKKFLGVLAGLALAVLTWTHLQAGNIPLFVGPACEESSQTLSCFNQLIALLNGASFNASLDTFNTNRNLLDNGAMQVQQRGTGFATCATTGALASTAYAADRWACDVNVTSGNGRLTIITSTPTPPLGFAASVKLNRQAAALTQTQCVWQEIPTWKAQTMQGQQVVLSAMIQALAGLATDQGSTAQVVNLVIITGTGSDEGFGSWTASPAITPAWTGIATAVNTPITLPVTPSWQKYQTTAGINTTVNEIGVGLCFTPTATGAGSTDGFAFTGVQLEQGAVASTYEFRSPGAELAEAQRYFRRINEKNTVTAIQSPMGSAIGTTTTCSVFIPFPVTMRAAPTYTNALTATTFTITSDSQAATALGTPFSATLGANSVDGASINFTTTGMTAKDACWLTSTAAGAGVIDFTADF